MLLRRFAVRHLHVSQRLLQQPVTKRTHMWRETAARRCGCTCTLLTRPRDTRSITQPAKLHVVPSPGAEAIRRHAVALQRVAKSLATDLLVDEDQHLAGFVLEQALEYFKNAYRLAPKRPTPPPLIVERVA